MYDTCVCLRSHGCVRASDWLGSSYLAVFVSGREHVAIYCQEIVSLFAVLTMTEGFNARKDDLMETEAEAAKRERHCGLLCGFFLCCRKRKTPALQIAITSVTPATRLCVCVCVIFFTLFLHANTFSVWHPCVCVNSKSLIIHHSPTHTHIGTNTQGFFFFCSGNIQST